MESIYQQMDRFFVNGYQEGLTAIVIGTIFILCVSKVLTKFIHKKWPDNHNTQMRMKKTIVIIIILALICSEIKALSSLAKALLASGGILAVVIGLASQEAASNIINGVMIMAYKPYKEGDFVVVHQYNVRGKIIDISLRHSVIETLEKTQVIVPNTIMNKAIIENVSQIEHTKANYLYVDIAYESDIDKAIEIIQKLANQHPLSVDGRSRSEKKKDVAKVPVHVTELKDSGIALRATIQSKDNSTGFSMLSDLRKEIILEFRKENIEIPYPHMDVTTKGQ